LLANFLLLRVVLRRSVNFKGEATFGPMRVVLVTFAKLSTPKYAKLACVLICRRGGVATRDN
jgi:hypothetical protein